MQPKISIIIPVYCAEKYIRRCLDSCINQSLKEIEIIIVDDCGKDDSLSIAQKYASTDLRIVILHHKQNLGTFQARNTGIKNAKGLYCMFCDSDDFLDIKACETAYKAIQTQKVDIAAFKMQHFPKTLRRVSPYVHQGKFIDNTMREIFAGSPNAESLCDKIILTKILKSACNILNFVQNHLTSFEDGLLLLVASFYANSYFGQKDIIYFYCKNDQSMTRQIGIKALHKKYADLEYILQIIQQLKTIFPQYINFIEKYSNKVVGTLILQPRFFKEDEFYKAYMILNTYNFTKKPLQTNVYVKSVFLSLQYHFRWQNLVRLSAYMLSFGKIKF